MFVNEVSADNKACITNGVNIIAAGAGLSDATIGPPHPGHRAVIRLATLTGSVTAVVTVTEGTFDGTNNTATFDAAEETLVLVYKDEDEWAIELNSGGVVLSDV